MHDIYTSTRDPKERSELCFTYYEISSGSMIDTLIKMQETVDKVTVEGLVAMYKAEGINEGIEKEEVRQTVMSLREKFFELNTEVKNMTQWIMEGVK
jgi:predicted hydrolase (HD superfamily)